MQRFRAEVVAGRDQGVAGASAGPLLGIGTAPGNQLIVTDPSVSRHHCVIEATEDGFLLRDLGSTNGTVLSGYRIKSAYLEPGAVITLGETSMRFDCSEEEVTETLSTASSFGDVLGTSVAMRRIFGLMTKIASADATVLITGETGTGKGAFAEALHQESKRKDGPFVVVDCGAIPDSLIESELFGHERGSFTGAEQQRIGAFEQADGGTVFLDEIGELGIDMQPKLLRVLENRSIRRVGGTETKSIDIRVVAATNRDLRAEVNSGGFRSDLFYRLNVMGMEIPPLRDRREDIPLLAAHFYRAFAGEEDGAPPSELLTRLLRQQFPGNVRELRTAIERAVVLGDLVDAHHTSQSSSTGFDYTLTYREAKELATSEWERSYLPDLLARYDGNLSRAARAVSMDRNHLRKLIKGISNE